MSALALAVLYINSQREESELAIEITSSVERAFSDISQAVSQIENGEQLAPDTDLDYVIYDIRGNVLYWTENSYIPPYEYFPFRQSDYVIANEYGEFLYEKKRIEWNGQEVYLVVITQLRRKYNQPSSYLADVYNRRIIGHNIMINEPDDGIPILYKGELLFSIQSDGSTFYSHQINGLITWLLLIFWICGLLLIFRLACWVDRKWSFWLGFFSLTLALIVLRGIISTIDLPGSFVRMDIFEPSTFTYNFFYYSLGDTLINFVMISLLLVFAILYGRKSMKSLSFKWEIFMGALMTILSYASLFLIVGSISLLLTHSQISLDIADSMEFDFERFSAYLLISILAIIFFMVHYLAYHILHYTQLSRNKFLAVQVVSALISLLILFFNGDFLFAFGLNLTYIIGLYVFKMPQSLKALKFDSLNYLLFTVIIVSVSGSLKIYKSYEKNDLQKMQKFATYLQIDRDIEGEYLLSNILEKIKDDIEVNSKMLNPQSQLQSIEQKIKRTYLSTYFGDYAVDIHLFDENGIGLSKKYKGLSIDRVKRRFDRPEFKTAHENVFYDRRMDVNRRKRYICFTEIQRYDKVNGYAEIELRLKKFSSKRVLPQLLIDRRIKSRNSYDYALIKNNEILYVSGNYPYNSDFDLEWLTRERVYNQGLEKNGYNHLASTMGDKVTIISSPLYKTADVVSNFAFLFIIFLSVAGVIGILRYFMIIRGNGNSLNFSTKILLFTGGSFIVPLLLVATAILTSTDNSYRKEIDKTNLKSTLLLVENLNEKFVEYTAKMINKEALENRVVELAADASKDINLYDTKGKLITSSTPEIFESGIISEYMNPLAYGILIEQKKDNVAKDEKIGSFLYKTIYVAVNSPDDGSILGYLAVPYFGSKNHLRRQQLIVFTNIIIIFSFVFIISIGIAYYVISRLTRPIMIIADRLHDTGFVQTNQPIEWTSDDEIGTLVQEYNNMLGKLEATKTDLARNEKEAAWREMAKQVAHEIKNPLTPMKLTIQHLERILGKEEKDKKSLEILLNQIDTLDEIVTSFSHFAKMPIPTKEPFDIGKVLEKSVNLHVDKDISLVSSRHDHFVLGDHKLFGRIFNNLILNGFQAMKNRDEPKMDIHLISKDNKIIMSFSDHGEGIPMEIREKVFMPNFSTKEAGSGIGLAVAKRGIEHAGGKIWFESKVGVGTTFFIQMDKIEEE